MGAATVVVVTSGTGSGFVSVGFVAHDANTIISIAITMTKGLLPLCIDVLLLYYYSDSMINRKMVIVHRYLSKYNVASVNNIDIRNEERQSLSLLHPIIISRKLGANSIGIPFHA
jgi:hypothetical protein